MTEVLKASAGYAVKTVADRIAAMDIDAQGNAEKAAWKRYMGLSMLALAKGVNKKNMASAVFGKDAKPSKNFSNMWSLAEKARNNPLLLGNNAWDDVRAMSIDDALDTVIGMINRHMAVLNVGGKNAYEPLAGMSLDEIAAKVANDEADAKAEAEEKAKAKEAEKLAADEAEAKAQEKASAAPELDIVQRIYAASAGASPDEIAEAMVGFTKLLLELEARDTLAIIHEQMGQILANTAKDVTPGPIALAG
jgi:hypothetical protein